VSALHHPELMFGSFTPPPQVTLSGVYSASASGGNATFTGVNLGVASPTNMVVVILYGSDLDAFGDDDVTIGGVTATLITQRTDGNGDNSGTTTAMYRAAVPNGGTGSIVVTGSYFKSFTANAVVYYARYVRSQTPHDTATDIDDSLSFSIDIPDEGFAIASGVFQTTSGTVSVSGLTEDVDQAGSDDGILSAASSENMAAETGRTISLNHSSTPSGSGVAASWY
jgi:hypothetical protein